MGTNHVGISIEATRALKIQSNVVKGHSKEELRREVVILGLIKKSAIHLKWRIML